MENYILMFEKRNIELVEKEYLKFTDKNRALAKEIKYDYHRLNDIKDKDELVRYFKVKEKAIYKKIKDFYQLNYKHFLNKKKELASMKEETRLAEMYINKVINVKDIIITDELLYNEIILTDDDYKRINEKDPTVYKKGKLNKDLFGTSAHDSYERDYGQVLDIIANSTVRHKEFIQFNLGFGNSIIDIKNIVRNDIRYNECIISQDIMDVKKRYLKYKKFIVDNKDLINHYNIDGDLFYKLEKMFESLDFEDDKLVISIGINSIVIEHSLRSLLSSLSSVIKNKDIDLNKISEMKNRITCIYFLIRVIYLQGRLLASIYKLILKTQKVNLNLLVKIEFLKSSLVITNKE